MARKIEVYGDINDEAKVNLKADIVLKQWIYDRKGKTIRVIFEEHKRHRSSPQNAYYWGVIVPMIRDAINDLGNSFTSDEVHDFLKREYNYHEVETHDGMYLKVPQSTTKLDTIGFNEYKDKIQQFASEILGIYIPDPNEEY